MSRLRLYVDEDAMRHALVVALRARRRVDVVTALERGMMGRSDEDHLRQASAEARLLYSFNVKDFAILHEQWIKGGQQHSGIVLASQQRFSVGDQLRRLLRLMNGRTAEGIRDRLEFLSNWAG